MTEYLKYILHSHIANLLPHRGNKNECDKSGSYAFMNKSGAILNLTFKLLKKAVCVTLCIPYKSTNR